MKQIHGSVSSLFFDAFQEEASKSYDAENAKVRQERVLPSDSATTTQTLRWTTTRQLGKAGTTELGEAGSTRQKLLRSGDWIGCESGAETGLLGVRDQRLGWRPAELERFCRSQIRIQF
ncbi:hypothetical protein PIB30_056443 [Stylosanthes scabra]|uniref:Uncharacterized protein n=1 Tax=Stylosanthes scabra TaxID=79078 RepID=A0ABU6VHW4_9FABA|nr:hypothetical protein [Stylosanthes scabra]